MPDHQVINSILETAEDTGDAGQDKLYGRGIVDAHAALTADVEQTNANPMGSIQEWITMHRRGEVEDTSGTDEDKIGRASCRETGKRRGAGIGVQRSKDE